MDFARGGFPAYPGPVPRFSRFLSCSAGVLVLAIFGCAVKPPLRYVAPDGSLHDVVVEPQRSRERRPQPPGEPAPESPAEPAAVPEQEPADEGRSHYLTAVGLQSECRFGEALALYRGYLEAEPEGTLAGRTLLRMAEIYLEPGFIGRDDERARGLLAEVAARFPGTAEATVACEMLGTDCLP